MIVFGRVPRLLPTIVGRMNSCGNVNKFSRAIVFAKVDAYRQMNSFNRVPYNANQMNAHESLHKARISGLPKDATEQSTKEAQPPAIDDKNIPSGLFAKMKYYFKRYGCIAFGVHTICCGIWLVSLYFIVRSGVDVIGFLEFLHIPQNWIESVKNAPPSAGFWVVVLLLYKIATPIRYMVSVIAIQTVIKIIKKFGSV